MTEIPDPRVDRWESRAQWPLTVAALAFLGSYAWPILDPGLSAYWLWLCGTVAGLTWLAFAVDFFARLALSSHRRNFVRHNLLDLAVVVLPIFQPLRLLRLVTLLSVLNRYAGGSLRGRVAVYVAGSTSLILLIASLAILQTERGAKGSNIESFSDALWWAMTTVTTVGYGDQYPVTGTGRWIAGALMVAGIALLGVVTASLASWLLDRVAEVEEESSELTRRDVVALTSEVSALRTEIARLRAHSEAGEQPGAEPDPGT